MPLSAEQLTEAYEEHAPRLRGYCYKRLRDRDVADDVVGQVFLDAARSAEHYEDRGLPLGAWLVAIAKNRCADVERRTKRHASLDAAPEVTARPRPTLDASVYLEQLTIPQREAMELCIAGKTYEEISRELGISYGAVAGRLKQARIRLRNIQARKPVPQPKPWPPRGANLRDYTSRRSDRILTDVALAGRPLAVNTLIDTPDDKSAVYVLTYQMCRKGLLVRAGKGVCDLGPQAPRWALLLRKHHEVING